jgi:hypothetical protein
LLLGVLLGRSLEIPVGAKLGAWLLVGSELGSELGSKLGNWLTLVGEPVGMLLGTLTLKRLSLGSELGDGLKLAVDGSFDGNSLTSLGAKGALGEKEVRSSDGAVLKDGRELGAGDRDGPGVNVGTGLTLGTELADWLSLGFTLGDWLMLGLLVVVGTFDGNSATSLGANGAEGTLAEKGVGSPDGAALTDGRELGAGDKEG